MVKTILIAMFATLMVGCAAPRIPDYSHAKTYNFYHQADEAYYRLNDGAKQCFGIDRINGIREMYQKSVVKSEISEDLKTARISFMCRNPVIRASNWTIIDITTDKHDNAIVVVRYQNEYQKTVLCEEINHWMDYDNTCKQ